MLSPLSSVATKSYRKYGFDELFQNVFKSFEDCSEIIENPVPDDSSVDPIGERSGSLLVAELMKQMEESKFDADHYLSDFFYGKEDYLYKEFIDIPLHDPSLPSPTFPSRLGQSRPHHPQASQGSLLAASSPFFLLRPSFFHRVDAVFTI